jgi:hypothetical protein
MNDALRAPVLFAAYGVLAALALQPRLGSGTALYGLFLLLGAAVVWGTEAGAGKPFAGPPAAALLFALALPAAAWFLQRPMAGTAALLAAVLFIGRHPLLPLPERPAFARLADLVAGFLLALLAYGAPAHPAVHIGAGHLGLAYAGLVFFTAGASRYWLLGHAAWLGFHGLGVAMVGLKFYPLMAFLPFFLGAGTALYALLTRQEPSPRAVRSYWGILALLGVVLLVNRIQIYNILLGRQ